MKIQVNGVLVPTGDGGGGDGAPPEYPFEITMISRYFSMEFLDPVDPDTFLLKEEKVPVSVSLINATGSPASGSVSFSTSLGSFGPNNPVDVSSGLANGELTITASGGTKAKIKANANNVDITDGNTAADELDSAELTAVEAVLTSSPIESLGVAAASAWPDQEEATTKAALILTVSPSDAGALQKVKDDLVLDIEKLTEGDDYTPSGLGSVTRQSSKDADDKIYWQYEAFVEPRTEKHPQTKKANIITKINDDKTDSPLLLVVRPVFVFLTGMHQHSSEGSYHSPTNADYVGAAQYAGWKYNVPRSNITSWSYAAGLSDNAVTVGSSTTFSDGAVTGENWCASAIGHENVHAGQPASYNTQQFRFVHWTLSASLGGPKDFYKLVELPAYQWQHDNVSAMGLNAAQAQEINSRIEQINNGEALGDD